MCAFIFIFYCEQQQHGSKQRHSDDNGSILKNYLSKSLMKQNSKMLMCLFQALEDVANPPNHAKTVYQKLLLHVVDLEVFNFTQTNI